MKKQITVMAFGPVSDIVGKATFVVEDVSTTDLLIRQLEQNFPSLKNLAYAVAVNKQLVSASVALEDGATVALLPPFSGG